MRMTIDGKVHLVRLVCLVRLVRSVCLVRLVHLQKKIQQTDNMMNFHLHNEQMVNKLRKIAWGSIICLPLDFLRKTSTFHVHVSMSHFSMFSCLYIYDSVFPCLHFHVSVFLGFNK